MKVTQLTLRPGVHLTAVQTKKFKSSTLAVRFLTPLSEADAARSALVPMVLRRGTAEHPDLESLSAALDELYGGSLEPLVRKKGETQCVGFVGSFLDDAYTLDGNRCWSRRPRCWRSCCCSPIPRTAPSAPTIPGRRRTT